MIKRIATTCVLSLCLVGNAVSAEDDVVNSINEGMDFYKNGEYAEATGSLNYAVQLIQQKGGMSVMPTVIHGTPGWLDGSGSTIAGGRRRYVWRRCQCRARILKR